MHVLGFGLNLEKAERSANSHNIGEAMGQSLQARKQNINTLHNLET